MTTLTSSLRVRHHKGDNSRSQSRLLLLTAAAAAAVNNGIAPAGAAAFFITDDMCNRSRRRDTTIVRSESESSSSWGDIKKITASPSYTDNWLLNFHNHVQSDRILTTNALGPYNKALEEQTASIKEWQESFQRNNLADFTPPLMDDNMNCLMVGVPDVNQQRNHLQTNKLPWCEDNEASEAITVTSLQVTVPSPAYDDIKDDGKDDGSSAGRSSSSMISHTESVVVPPTTNSNSDSTGLRIPKTDTAVYDCIVDQGLLGAVLLSQPDQVRELLLEAAVALREHGIYVLATEQLMEQHKNLLTSLTNQCGLEWQFALDGISDDQTQISVARRFNSGPMPEVGRLSRYQSFSTPTIKNK